MIFYSNRTNIVNTFMKRVGIEKELTKKDLVYFNQAILISSLSKDKERHVGSIIIDEKGKVVSEGYNGAVSNLNDSNVPHSRKSTPLVLNGKYSEIFDGDESVKIWYTNKYSFMIHAEMNAILTCENSNRMIGSTIYITHWPCNNCANVIAQSGITTVKILNQKVGNQTPENLYDVLYLFEKKGIDLYIETDLGRFDKLTYKE